MDVETACGSISRRHILRVSLWWLTSVYAWDVLCLLKKGEWNWPRLWAGSVFDPSGQRL